MFRFQRFSCLLRLLYTLTVDSSRLGGGFEELRKFFYFSKPAIQIAGFGRYCHDLVIHFTLVMNQAILGLALLAAKTESVERRFSKTSGGGSLNGLPASKLAASICSVSAGQRGSFVRTARPRRVGRPDEARCSVAGADARPLPRREPSCTTRGCRCGVGFWPCGWPALRKQG